ncbi:MAG: beta-ketoacyl-[acyl-carrier-protein] synthase family protein [Turneriella sp.]|nr:beta-ketoacyl-[acyl-carrier-protein] synthase family protein [Turneriella sp.]
MKRCVVTGIGIISPLGSSKEIFWENLLAGKTGVGEIEGFDASTFPAAIAAEVKDFDEAEHLSGHQSKYLGKASKFAYAAAKMALADAALPEPDPLQTDVLIGCAVGSYEALEKALELSRSKLLEFEPGLIDMKDLLQSVTYSPASAVALLAKSEGYVSTISSSCVSGINAIGLAAERIQSGKARIVITGGVDTPISRIVMGALAGSKMTPAKGDSVEDALCPFDQRRTKSVLGEGAGIFILEEYEYAKARHARIYAEIAGFAQGSENVNELYMLDRTTKSWARVIRKALEKVKGKVSYVNAHAPSDQLLDRTETRVLEQIFGERELQAVEVSSIKGATGSPFSAAGAFQVAASAMALATKEIPPNYNYKVPDPECQLNVVPSRKRAPKLKTVLVNGHGLGGLNSALVLREVKNERL